MPETRLSPRERLVLTAIIELYIATGEPVASQAVARLFCGPGWAELGDTAQRDGIAGRCRTAGAAAYVGRTRSHGGGIPLLRGTDHAAGRAVAGACGRKRRRDSADSPLSEARRGQIEESFSRRVKFSNDYLERTSHVLALISSGLGVALASSTAGQVLEHIHFSRLSTGRVLAVLVTQAGAVQDRVLAVDHN